MTVNTGTFTSASDYHHVSIAAGATLAQSGNITVSGNWNNAGTLTHNNHTVILDGGDQQVLGDTDFFNLMKTVASAVTLTFEAGKTTTLGGALTLQGVTGQLLFLRSSTPGTRWNINPRGTRTIGYVDVQDSNNTNGAAINAGEGSINSNNTVNWLFYPDVTTQAVTGIGINAATGNGNITDLGIPNPTAHGVCWGTSTNPTTSDGKKDMGATTSTGAFTTAITGLGAATAYHVRAFATNTAGTSYGEDVTFTTLPNPPGVPVAKAATASNATGFTANWNTSTGATGYRLDVATNSAFTSYVSGYQDKDVGNVTTTNISGLSGGASYYYRVRQRIPAAPAKTPIP